VAWGGSGVLVLIVFFMAALAGNLMRGRTPHCHCFGQLHSSPAGWTTLSRNALLAGLAGFVAWQGPGATITEVASGFSRTVVIVGVVVASQTVIGLAVLYELLRQNGRTLRRLEAIETSMGIAAEQPQSAGLPVRSVAPAFSLVDLNGRTVT